MAERVGFEPTVHCCTQTFEIRTLNHSDTSPSQIYFIPNPESQIYFIPNPENNKNENYFFFATPGASLMIKGRTNAYVPYKDVIKPASDNVRDVFFIF